MGRVAAVPPPSIPKAARVPAQESRLDSPPHDPIDFYALTIRPRECTTFVRDLILLH